MSQQAPNETPFDLAITDKLLSTTRAVRRRLDLQRPVEREVILDCLRLAQQAPTGSNRQGWSWLVISDGETKRALADLYRRNADKYLSDGAVAAARSGAAQDERVFNSAIYLAENLQDVPVHVIPCIEIGHLPEKIPPAAWAGVMGSIFPAVWSFQLALRARGLGSAITTLHLASADEAAKLLGLPETVMQVALLPVAYTKGWDFKPAERPPVETITHFDRW